MTEPRPTPSDAAPRQFKPQTPWVSAVGYFIFFSRWLQAPLYVGLVIAQAIYVVVFMVELWHLGEEVVGHWPHIEEATIMLGVLDAVSAEIAATLTSHEVDRRVNNSRTVDARDPGLIEPLAS